MDEKLTLEFDGGSRGNPGPAGIGVVVRAADGTPLVTLGRFIGRATNNVADKLANMAMDRKADVTEVSASQSALDEPSLVAPKIGDQFQCARCGCMIEL